MSFYLICVGGKAMSLRFHTCAEKDPSGGVDGVWNAEPANVGCSPVCAFLPERCLFLESVSCLE